MQWLLILHNFPVGNIDILFLLLQKLFDGRNVGSTAFIVSLFQLLQHHFQALLYHFDSILDPLIIELRVLRDGSDGGEDGVVLHAWVTGSERRDHGDPLGAAEGSQGLVLDVSTLQNDSRALVDYQLTTPMTTLERRDLPSAGLGP